MANEGGEKYDAEGKKVKDRRERVTAVGAAKRSALGITESAASGLIRERIAEIAGQNNMVVEWTLRPRTADVADASGGCGCFCGCGCSCIA